MKKTVGIILTFIIAMLCSCERINDLDARVDLLETKVEDLEAAVSAINDNTISIRTLLQEGIAITGVVRDDSSYTLELSDGTTITVTDGLKIPVSMPIIGIDEDGDWIISTDGGETFRKIVKTAKPTQAPAADPKVRVNSDGYWEISMDNGESWNVVKNQKGKPVSAKDGKEVAGVKTFFSAIDHNEADGTVTFTLADGRILSLHIEKSFYFEIIGYKKNETIYLNETLKFEVKSEDISEVALSVPNGWAASYENNLLCITAPSNGAKGIYDINIIAVSSRGYLRNIRLTFTLIETAFDPNASKEWKDFVASRESNVLLDFSYAGYKYGETEPIEAIATGYKVYDVTEYGAIANDGLSDREAFLNTLTAALGISPIIDAANCISYGHRPEANVIIYFPEGEFILHTAEDDIDGRSQSILIQAGNFIIRGAGRDKTTIIMNDPMQPEDQDKLYSSPDMIQVKHNSTYSSYTVPVKINGVSHKGEFHVKVTSTAGINEGDWVCLHVKNNDDGFVASELSPYSGSDNWDIVREGVEVIEYHKIKEIHNNLVLFYEPLHHAVNPDMGWELKKYPHLKNVGIEDLAFKGYAKDDFQHHASWEDDGGFKPLSINRTVDSWIRRVRFESVSEACSIINSANVSAYDIIMEGVRGHSAIRSQASSRVLIAATTDRTSEGAGNFHAVGVSRQSIGTVLWRNVWGDDSCFESHATQPRATLIDCCSGGWHRGHQGGDSNLAPHHLADLTIWNFKATSAGESGEFPWWGTEAWWKFLPPVIVGFQSETNITFSEEQTLSVSMMNETPSPESLYEAQLKHRLGYIPAWLNTLK